MGKDWGHIMLEFSRRALTIGGFSIYWYGLLIALGVLAGCLLSSVREKKLGVPKDTSINLALLCVPVGILCARLYYVAFSWSYYAAHPAEIFAFRDGGLAVYGGIAGALFAGWIYGRRKKLSFYKMLDLVAPAVALGQCIGRWGNFLNQEAYGMAVQNPHFQFFPFAVYIDGSGWHYAAFFYESLWCAIIVAALLIGEKKHVFQKNGDTFFAYAFLYAAERSVVEGLRTDSLYIGPLRVSQLLSLCMLLLISALLLRRAKKCRLRCLPMLAAVCMCAASAMQSIPWTLIFGLLCVGFGALVYLHISRSNHA